MQTCEQISETLLAWYTGVLDHEGEKELYRYVHGQQNMGCREIRTQSYLVNMR